MSKQPTSKAGEKDWEKGLEKVLDGIDRDEVDDGWWETSTGVLFGEMKLKQVKDFIAQALHRKDEEWKEKVQGLRMEKKQRLYHWVDYGMELEQNKISEGIVDDSTKAPACADGMSCSFVWNQAVDEFNAKVDELTK